MNHADPFGAAAQLLLPTLTQAAPLSLAAMGGILSERVGVINIALEGMMLAGAFTAMAADQFWGLAAGLAAGLVAGGALGLLHLILTQWYRVNHIISGIALNILSLAGTTYLVRVLYTEAAVQRDTVVRSPAALLPFVALAMLLPPTLQFGFRNMRVGLQMRAVGEAPHSASMAGVPVPKMRAIGVIGSGLMAGTAGAYLSLADVHRFEENMISGRGYIALAVVICGRWEPVRTLAACLVFGLFDSLQFQLQGNVRISGELLRSLPYIITILAAVLWRPRPPAALGALLDP